MSLNMGYPMISCNSEINVPLFFSKYPKLKMNSNVFLRLSQALSATAFQTEGLSKLYYWVH